MLRLTKKDMPSSQIKDISRPKISKNGYRYDKKIHVHVVNTIFELYTMVTWKCKVTNGHINKSFTRGVIHWLHGNHLDLVKYAVYCGMDVSELREMNATNVIRHVETNGVHEVKQVP